MTSIVAYSFFIDPENLIAKNEIINNKITENPKNLQNKFVNDAIIEINSDTESSTFQSQFEKNINKPELTLEVLKEETLNDKENVSSASPFDEFHKKSRGRPKKCHNENIDVKKKHKEKCKAIETTTTTAKTFNISLGFLNSKNKTSRDTAKKSINSIHFDNHNNDLKKNKKRGRPKRKFEKIPISNTDSNEIENFPLDIKNKELNNENGIRGHKSIEISENNTQIDEKSDNSVVVVKKKRGRPFGTFKNKDKKFPGQKGRPLSNKIIEIAPKRQRGRPFQNNTLIKRNSARPGRPSLGIKKLKKYDRPGRPRGPPKPIKKPAKRGRKPNPDTPSKPPKIPGRGRGRPSFALLKILKDNEMKTESSVEECLNSASKIIKNDYESENKLNISENSNNRINTISDNTINNIEIESNLIKMKDAPLLKNNLPILNKDLLIDNVKIETISITSSDSSDDSMNSTIDSDNNKIFVKRKFVEEQSFTISDKKFKIGAQLDYMFRETKNIFEKHYS